MLCADMVEVCWTEPAGKRQKVMGLLEDISPSGACLQLDTAVPPGVEIRWGSPPQQFSGRVRYCVYREIGYFAGVQFHAESKWSKKMYRPQHLLDLKQLLDKTKV